MNTILKTATGVFAGLVVFAAFAYFGYSHISKAEAEEAAAIEQASILEREKLLAEQDSIIAELTKESPYGKWVEKEIIDPITDAKSIVIGTYANGDELNKPILTIACSDNSTRMFVNWQDYINSSLMTTTRINDETFRETGWKVSNDHTSTLFPSSPISTIKKLMESERYVVRGRSMSGEVYTAVFELKGLKESVKPVRELCGW